MDITAVVADVCRTARNWFTPDSARYVGAYTIQDGALDISALPVLEGQYIRVVGSALNDGVYQWPYTFAADESFNGCIWLMRVPAEFLHDCQRIAEWREKYEENADSPYVMESFGGYSYTKTTQSQNTDKGWVGQFSSVIRKWRKM